MELRTNNFENNLANYKVGKIESWQLPSKITNVPPKDFVNWDNSLIKS